MLKPFTIRDKTFLPNTVWEVLASERQEKELKVTRTGKEESELLLFRDPEKKPK